MPSRSREFAEYVPALILRHFRDNPTPPTQATGDHLPAVALFADIAGSTKITNELTRLGRLHGPEEMYRILNAYYEPLVSRLNARGGDVIGFAGDAVMALWPADGGAFGPAVRQATQCALEIQRDLNEMELAPGVRLSLRICLGAGEVSTALVGGRQGFWQLVASGPPMDQIRAAGSVVQIGKVYLSVAALAHVGAGAAVEPYPGGGAFVRRLANPPPPPDPASLPDVTALPEESLRPFVQRAVQQSIDAGMADYLGQSRTVGVVFVRLGRPPGVPPSWQRVQDAMGLVQDAAARYEGTVAQFIEDDKGLISLLAFGLPMVGHEDDPRRAVEAAAFLQEHAPARGLRCAIGASTGLPFCGALGAPGRRVVYTVTGADVVRAARLMQLARDGEILCDEDTHEAARKATAHRFVPLPRFALKGYATPARVFRVVPRGTGQRFIQIGREREWELFLGALDGAAAGHGRVIWLEGAPGTGVVPLATELIERTAGRVKRLGVPDPAAEASSPWAAVCADLFGLRRVRDLVRQQERVAAFFAPRPGSGALFNDWLGTSLPESPDTRALAVAARAAARDALLVALVEELARERPLLVIVEHAHRLDQSGLALAQRLAAIERVTLLATAEPVAGSHPLRDTAGALVVTLKPLDEPTLVRRLCERLRAETLGERFVTLLRERAEGNPERAAAEFIRLLEEDRLVIDHGLCELTDAPTAPVSRHAARGPAPLIGRTAERAAVGQALDAVLTGKSRAVLIEGDTGTGKSRLIEEARRMGEDRAMLVAIGHCSAVEAATPHFPWRAICDELLGLSELTDPTERGARVLAALEATPEHRAFAPLLNDLLGLQLPQDEVVRQMVGQNRADNLNAVLAGLIAAAADGRPTLLLIEDAQWADTASWRLAKVVRERLAPVAVALSVRNLGEVLPEEYTHLAASEEATRVALDALAEADAREFARVQFGAERVSDALARLVWERTRGNPLFVEQIAGHLLEAGLVAVAADGTADLRAGGAGSDIPDSVRGLVTARIDRLPPAHQLTAKVSSVIGTLFPTSALTAIYPDRDAVGAVPEHVGVLTRERLLRLERAEPEAVYDFPHPVLQQVCYEMLTRPQRQRLHRSAAEWFQSDQAGGRPQFRLVAHHWGRAGVADKQVEYLARAGDTALRDGAFREAATGFEEVLRLSRELFPAELPPEEQARRAHWEYQLGEARFGLGELPTAAEHFRASLLLRGRPVRTSKAGLTADALVQFFRQLGRRVLPWRASSRAADAETREVAATYLRLGRICYFANDVLPGTNAVLRALNLAETVGPSPELGLAYASVTILSVLLRWDRAGRVYSRLAEEVARSAGNLEAQCLVLAYLAMYHLGQGNWERVEALAREALDLALRIGDHQQQGDNATILAMLACFRADYPESLRWCERVIASAGRSGNAMHVAWTANLEGECHLRQGRDAEAEAKLKESAAGLRGNKSRTEEVRIEGMLAALFARAGDFEAATAHADAAEEVAREASATTCSTLEGFAGIAEVRFAQAECAPANAQAREVAESALVALRKHAKVFPIGRPRTALFEGRMQFLRGAPAKALRVWKAGLAEAERLRMPFDTALLHEALSRHLPADSLERRRHRDAALTLYEQIGAVIELNRLRAES